MKILWLCNIPLPEYSEKIGISKTSGGGWLTGLKNDLRNNLNIELNICFPQNKIEVIKELNIDSVNYFAVPRKISDVTKIDNSTEKHFQNIIDKVNPDIIHIWGTEFSHTLSMMNVCEKNNLLDRTIISIQGLVSVCVNHYLADLPDRILKRFTIRDFLKQDNILQQKEKFRKRGIFEIEALKKAQHIIGRTDWDKACISQINLNTKYHFCNETLRGEFYKHQWNYKECEKYSIFISQATYPIKGLHYMLKALPEIIKKYPKTKLYVAGGDIIKADSLKEKLKISSYGKYLKELIEKMQLKNYVIFTGNLDEKKMCERFLKSNVFVLASSIENSPNSLGEAMILGVPVISSDVGGVKNMLNHNEDGFIYQHNATYMLAYYVKTLFQNIELAETFSNNSKIHAKVTHSKEINSNRIIEIYKKIIGENS